MTLNHSSEALLRENPSAVFLDFNKEPTLKSILPALKASPKLMILEETGDYAIVGCTTLSKNKDRKYKLASRKGRSKAFQASFMIRPKVKEGIFPVFLKQVGIKADSISAQGQEVDKPIIIASGIFLNK